ncbi:hypothetical protein ACS0TY_006978 [Phlomoides rotata]
MTVDMANTTALHTAAEYHLVREICILMRCPPHFSSTSPLAPHSGVPRGRAAQTYTRRSQSLTPIWRPAVSNDSDYNHLIGYTIAMLSRFVAGISGSTLLKLQ